MYCTPTNPIKLNHSVKISFLLLLSSAALSLTACNTFTAHSDKSTPSQIKQQTNSQRSSQEPFAHEEQVISVGQATPNLSAYHGRNVVLATQNKSYVMDQGGLQFFYLLNQLDSLHLDVPKILNFTSRDQGQGFEGNISMAYVNLKEDLTQKQLLFLFENHAQNCTSSNDSAVQALRFCFNIPIHGKIYPAASNI